MSKKTKKETVASGSPAVNQPAYVQELIEKGATVLTATSRNEIEEKLAAIPADIAHSVTPVTYYYSSGLYRVQVNKE